MDTIRIFPNSRKHPDKFITIDADDLPLVSPYTWHVSNCAGILYASAYARGGRNQPEIRMHRLLLNPPPGMHVDHVNGDGLDNRRANIRICTRSQNMANVSKRPGTSRFKGVYWDGSRDRWVARVRIDGIMKNLGRFDDEVEAAIAYDAAALEEFGEFAALNFPRDPEKRGFVRIAIEEAQTT